MKTKWNHSQGFDEMVNQNYVSLSQKKNKIKNDGFLIRWLNTTMAIDIHSFLNSAFIHSSLRAEYALLFSLVFKASHR